MVSEWGAWSARRCLLRADRIVGAIGKEFCSLPVSEEAEVADAHKAARQQVKQEAAQELFDRQGHEPLLVAVCGVAPTEGDVAVGKSNYRLLAMATR